MLQHLKVTQLYMLCAFADHPKPILHANESLAGEVPMPPALQTQRLFWMTIASEYGKLAGWQIHLHLAYMISLVNSADNLSYIRNRDMLR